MNKDTNIIQSDEAESITRASGSIFWLTEGTDGRLYLLGYPLDLTPRERCILDVVIRRYPQTVAVDAICAECVDLSSGSVPVHINAINKKSALIGGRRLIIAQRKVGYILNSFM